MMESRISALVDGELEQEEASALLAAVKKEPGLRQEWQHFHLIGDALRQTPPLSPDFSARFAAQLEKEPTVLAPRRFPQPRRPLIALSAAASVAAVSLVAWVALQFNTAGSGPAVQATVAEASPASAAPAVNVSSYLIAHQEYSRAAQETSSYQRASLEKPRGGSR